MTDYCSLLCNAGVPVPWSSAKKQRQDSLGGFDGGGDMDDYAPVSNSRPTKPTTWANNPLYTPSDQPGSRGSGLYVLEF